MSSLKNKTIAGLSWSFIDNISQKGITFIIGIILARLLSPEEFGLIGMMTIFIAISITFINSGFSIALIRKKDCSNIEYSTVFYSNLIIGLLFYAVLYFTSNIISDFFNEPALNQLIKVFALVLIIDAFTMIQRTILTKKVDFKLQTQISILSSISGGVVGIILAYSGYGVWSLVYKQLIQRSVNSLLLWLWNRWMPSLVFSFKSFKELFNFGSKLLISALIDTIYKHLYSLIIAKYFSSAELGYYTRARQFQSLAAENLMQIINRVSFPVLSQVQDDPVKLNNHYRKMLKSTMLISFTLLLGMSAVSEAMVITLIGEKWRPSIIYLQLLCFVGMLYPLHSLNLNILNVKGRSDLFLKLEIIKKSLAVPVILVGIKFGIVYMILGMIINSFISFFINSFYSGRLINYSTWMQIKDLIPSFIIAFFMASLVYLTGILLDLKFIYILFIQLFIGFVVFFTSAELFKLESYMFIKNIVIEKLKRK